MDDEQDSGHREGLPIRERVSSGAGGAAPAPRPGVRPLTRPGLALQPPGEDPGYAELTRWWRRHLPTLPPEEAEAWWLASIESMTDRQLRERVEGQRTVPLPHAARDPEPPVPPRPWLRWLPGSLPRRWRVGRRVTGAV